jgi:hypothetical protein
VKQHTTEVAGEFEESLRLATENAELDFNTTMRSLRQNLYYVQQKLLGLFRLNIPPANHAEATRLTTDRFEALTVFMSEMVFALFQQVLDAVAVHEKDNKLFRSRLRAMNHQLQQIFSSYTFLALPNVLGGDDDPAVVARARTARFKRDATEPLLDDNDEFFYRRCAKSGPPMSTVLASGRAARLQLELAALKKGTPSAPALQRNVRQRTSNSGAGNTRMAANGKPFDDL